MSAIRAAHPADEPELLGALVLHDDSTGGSGGGTHWPLVESPFG
jgi:hypothetical protein